MPPETQTGRTPSVPVSGFHYGKRLMSAPSPNPDEIGRKECKYQFYKDLVIGEHLANGVHLFPAGRDPMTELKEQTKRP